MKTLILILLLPLSSLATIQERDNTQPQMSVLDKNELLIKSIKEGDFQKAESLLQEGVNASYTGFHEERSLFQWLSFSTDEQGSIEFLPILLKYESNIDLRNKSGDTGLMTAIVNQKYKLARAFIRHGARLNLQNEQGITIFHIISVMDLSEQGVDFLNLVLEEAQPEVMNIIDTDGFTFIHMGVFLLNVHAVRALISSEKIDVNIKNPEGSTPVMKALSLIWSDLLEIDEEVAQVTQETIDRIRKRAEIAKIILASPYVDLTVKNMNNLSPQNMIWAISQTLSTIKDPAIHEILSPIVENYPSVKYVDPY